MKAVTACEIAYIGDGESVISSTQALEMRARFEEWPLLVEGESKIVKLLGNDLVIIKLKPTLFSYSANRTAVVEGTDELRLKISQVLWTQLSRAGIDVPVLCVGQDFYISRKVDAPPIEIIVKSAHVGTPKHLYQNMSRFPTRTGGTVQPEMRHEPYVRFDWRNPLPYKDECMPDWLANQFIDIKKAGSVALDSFRTLQGFLKQRGIEMLDVCFFISADGQSLFGEISPDCMRAKYAQDDLDKDLWRKGKDPEMILKRWRVFLELVTK
jgi:phosphoribosylaminoimidazole-succinocarboxamide synthase